MGGQEVGMIFKYRKEPKRSKKNIKKFHYEFWLEIKKAKNQKS